MAFSIIAAPLISGLTESSYTETAPMNPKTVPITNGLISRKRNGQIIKLMMAGGDMILFLNLILKAPKLFRIIY